MSISRKIALCEYEQGHEVSPHSIQYAHFLPATVVVDTNYQIDSWDKYMQTSRMNEATVPRTVGTITRHHTEDHHHRRKGEQSKGNEQFSIPHRTDTAVTIGVVSICKKYGSICPT